MSQYRKSFGDLNNISEQSQNRIPNRNGISNQQNFDIFQSPEPKGSHYHNQQQHYQQDYYQQNSENKQQSYDQNPRPILKQRSNNEVRLKEFHDEFQGNQEDQMTFSQELQRLDKQQQSQKGSNKSSRKQSRENSPKAVAREETRPPLHLIRGKPGEKQYSQHTTHNYNTSQKNTLETGMNQSRGGGGSGYSIKRDNDENISSSQFRHHQQNPLGNGSQSTITKQQFLNGQGIHGENRPSNIIITDPIVDTEGNEDKQMPNALNIGQQSQKVRTPKGLKSEKMKLEYNLRLKSAVHSPKSMESSTHKIFDPKSRLGSTPNTDPSNANSHRSNHYDEQQGPNYQTPPPRGSKQYDLDTIQPDRSGNQSRRSSKQSQPNGQDDQRRVGESRSNLNDQSAISQNLNDTTRIENNNPNESRDYLMQGGVRRNSGSSNKPPSSALKSNVDSQRKSVNSQRQQLLEKQGLSPGVPRDKRYSVKNEKDWSVNVLAESNSKKQKEEENKFKLSSPGFIFCFIVCLLLFSLMIVAWYYMSRGFESLGVAHYAVSNLKKGPIIDFVALNECSTGYEQVKLSLWPGIPNQKSTVDLLKWGNTKFCVKRASSFHITKDSSCNSGFKLCNVDLCIKDTEECPITSIERVSVITTATNVTHTSSGLIIYKSSRNYFGNPIQLVESSIQGRSCYASPMRWQTTTKGRFPDLQEGFYDQGCKYDVDYNTLIIEEGTSEKAYYELNNVDMTYGDYAQYAESTKTYLVSRPRAKILLNDKCTKTVIDEPGVILDLALKFQAVKDRSNLFLIAVLYQFGITVVCLVQLCLVRKFNRTGSDCVKTVLLFMLIFLFLAALGGIFFMLTYTVFRDWEIDAINTDLYKNVRDMGSNECFIDEKMNTGINDFNNLINRYKLIDFVAYFLIGLYGLLFILFFGGSISICRTESREPQGEGNHGRNRRQSMQKFK